MENELEGLDERARRAVEYLDSRLSAWPTSQEPVDPSYWAHARAELIRLARENNHNRDVRELVISTVSAALTRAGFEEVDDPGEAIDVLRERAERAESELAALRKRVAELKPVAHVVFADGYICMWSTNQGAVESALPGKMAVPLVELPQDLRLVEESV